MAELAEIEPEKPRNTPPTNPHLAPPFNKANAREMQRLSVIARNQAKLKTVARSEQTMELPEYLALRLTRVRKQIEQLNRLFEAEKDAGKLDRLASALYRLSELERTMAGRPLPGSLKPASVRSRRNSAPLSPIDPPAQEPG